MQGLPRGLVRYGAVTAVLILLLVWMKSTSRMPSIPDHVPSIHKDKTPIAPEPPLQDEIERKARPGEHPISTLIRRAEEDHNALLRKETKDISAAAAAYRERRGRHPPPGFKAWYQFAKKNRAIMVEDYFDQIYHDTAPLWGIDPHQLRLEAKNFEVTISVRNGNATASRDKFWTRMWLDLIKTVEQFLPDLDMPINVMDEPRLLVPWEKVSEYMEKERKSRYMPAPRKVLSEYTGLTDFDKEPAQKLNEEWDKKYPYFPKAARGCAPEDPARLAAITDDWSRNAHVSLEWARPHLYKGYVANWTMATSYCHQPDLQNLHGMFIEPLSIKSSDHLMPMFGGSKLATNNEILLPGAMYTSSEELFTGGDDHGIPWEDKQNKLIWRGAATGGRNKITNWKGFQRQRFVSMANGTSVGRAENWTEIPPNFELPPSLYDLRSAREKHMGQWLHTFSDVSLMDLLCFPRNEGGGCDYSDPYFHAAPKMPMKEQYSSKYLPDLDGNSFSGRYRAFLLSTSLPIKATIFKEWHDSRLIPWKHFVPMDMHYLDFYGIMEYFFGYTGFGEKDKANAVPGHDEAAKKIAIDGQAWANTVLRHEDMQIYVFRLLLEFSRLCDDNRVNLGFVEDIKGKKTGPWNV